ncbi:MAG: FAD-binding protein [Oligoflexia bacterium]|nr:FAD-binding protein [Oligoflexia bacterium]
MKDILSRLRDEHKIEILFNEDLTLYSRLRLKGSRGDVIVAKSEEDLKIIVKALSEKDIEYKIIGAGSNQIYPEVSQIPYLKISSHQQTTNDIRINEREEYEFDAATPLFFLTKLAIDHGLKGWESFTGIPASLGGAVFMNAGTELGEISQIVSEVKIITKNGQEKILKKSRGELPFSYRKNLFVCKGDVISKVKLIHLGICENVGDKIKKYQHKRSTTQPLDKYTCGCAYKNFNTLSAGKLIDLTGLKGFIINDIQISHLHANFIENKEKGTYSDFCQFVKIVREELLLQYGIKFELEIQV